MLFHENQQTILVKYHALFVNFEKAAKLLQIIGGALWVKFHLYGPYMDFFTAC